MRRRILLSNTGDIEPDPNTGRGMVGGYECVDLDLPSGILWATCNVGADTETDYGQYYQYGKGSRTYGETSGETVYGGNERPLYSSADTATQVMGDKWVTPTTAEMDELMNNTYCTTVNGRNVKLTSKVNSSKYIILPASGFYQAGRLNSSCSYYSNSTDNIYPLRITYGQLSQETGLSRNIGAFVRGITRVPDIRALTFSVSTDDYNYRNPTCGGMAIDGKDMFMIGFGYTCDETTEKTTYYSDGHTETTYETRTVTRDPTPINYILYCGGAEGQREEEEWYSKGTFYVYWSTTNGMTQVIVDFFLNGQVCTSMGSFNWGY